MTPDQAIDYLKRNRQYLNISSIAKEANINNIMLLNVLRDYTSPVGYKRKIPELKLFALAEVVAKLQCMEIKNPQEELASLEKHLAALYKSISDKYRKMIKASEEQELSTMQSSIDSDVVQIKAVRERMIVLKKDR
jgi:hypothetical protein